jgi:hypothetical protein
MRGEPFLADPGTLQFQVHIYTMQGVEEEQYKGKLAALLAADQAFSLSDVYLVKVWYLRKGPEEPENDNAAGLIKLLLV